MLDRARSCCIVLTCLPLLAGGCWPGRCGGALRGTPWVSVGEHAPCTEGPGCAELIDAGATFHQNADFARVEDPRELLAASKLDAESWFLVDDDGKPIASRIEPSQFESAHSCASAVGFDLIPAAPLEPGVYRLVVLIERVRWPVLRQGVAVSSWAGEPAIVEYYRVAG